jgi:hypothetical protein
VFLVDWEIFRGVLSCCQINVQRKEGHDRSSVDLACLLAASSFVVKRDTYIDVSGWGLSLQPSERDLPILIGNNNMAVWACLASLEQNDVALNARPEKPFDIVPDCIRLRHSPLSPLPLEGEDQEGSGIVIVVCGVFADTQGSVVLSNNLGRELDVLGAAFVRPGSPAGQSSFVKPEAVGSFCRHERIWADSSLKDLDERVPLDVESARKLKLNEQFFAGNQILVKVDFSFGHFHSFKTSSGSNSFVDEVEQRQTWGAAE